ncbi:MAG: DUF6702 family protein, partial [Planctomycetota bacterium]
AEWNPKSRSLEIALQITPAQLEEVVEKHAKREVDLDAAASDAAVFAWLRSVVLFTPPDADPTDDQPADPVTLKYVGKEVGISSSWVYFEAPLPGGWENVTAENRIRLIIEPEQHNTLVLNVLRPGPAGTPRKERSSYTFDRLHPSHLLKPADLKPLKKPDDGAPPAIIR